MCRLRSGLLWLMVSAPVLVAAQTRLSGNLQASEPPPQAGSVPDPSYTRDAFSTAMTGAPAALGPGDLVEIGVFDTPELTQRVRVNGEGKITLELIGEIMVRGMAPDSLRELIRRKLIDGHFVKDPQVTVFVAEYAGQLVYVMGEVGRPGAYPLLRSHRLQDFIAVAGGLTPRAGNSVAITRAADPTETLHVDLSDKEMTGKSEKDVALGNPEISPGDRITVGLTGIVYVLGDVQRPGGFLIDRRSTLSVLEALALAEGPTQNASLTHASLLHSREANPQPIPVNIQNIVKAKDPNLQLEPGDIIWVAGSQTRNLGRLAIATILATASGVATYASYTR